MADLYQLKGEVTWYTDELKKNERELDAATRELPRIKSKGEETVRAAENELKILKRKNEEAVTAGERKIQDLKSALEDTKRKLDAYKRDVARLEAVANDNRLKARAERDGSRRAA